MNNQTKTILSILGVLAIFTFTFLAVPESPTDLTEVYLSPPEIWSITLMDLVWGVSALAASVAYIHWLWKKA